MLDTVRHRYVSFNWISLPLHLRDPSLSLQVIKGQLKIYLE